MAGITINDSDSRRIASMWAECGIQFRSNLVMEGGVIPLHGHGYDHVALITHGLFAVEEITTEGETKEYVMASRDFDAPESVGYRIVIPAGHRHRFTLIESHGQPGEVLCMWAE